MAFTPLIEKVASKERSQMRSECVFDNKIPLCPVPCVPTSLSVIFWLFHGLLLKHVFFLIFPFIDETPIEHSALIEMVIDVVIL